MSCFGCIEQRARDDKDRRWWRNICGDSSSEGDSRSENRDVLQSRDVLQRHVKECKSEPSLLVYSVRDFPGVGPEAPADASMPSRACRLPANTESGVPIRTANFEGTALLMVQRDPAYHSPKDRFFHHFDRRKRIWEFRVQGRFRRIPTGDMYIGIVQRDFNYNQPIAMNSRWVQKMAMMLVKYEVYMHWGDRCEEARLPDAELAHLVTNMCAWDQIVATPVGERPPPIASDLTGLGILRKEEGLKEYTKSCNEILQDIRLDTTYTFCFWGVSQLLDVVHWQFLFKISAMPMAKFFEEWPIHCCMYELDASQTTETDKRHLESRKRYYMDYIVMSTTQPAIVNNTPFTDRYSFRYPAASLEELPDAYDVDCKRRLSVPGADLITRLTSGISNGSSPSGGHTNGRSDEESSRSSGVRRRFFCCKRQSPKNKHR